MNQLRLGGKIVRTILDRAGVDAWEKTIHGATVRLPVSGYGLKSLFLPTSLEHYEGDYFRRVIELIRPDSIVFDIGAYRGLYTVFAARACAPGGRVIAFEPNPVAFEVLRATIAANRLENVLAHGEALSDHCGSARMWIDGSAPTASLQPVGMRQPREIEVAVTTVDQCVAATAYLPDLIKIDVEGFELHVLQGARLTLAGGVRYICCEVHPRKLAALGRREEELMRFVAAVGYREIYRSAPADRRAGSPFDVIFEKDA